MVVIWAFSPIKKMDTYSPLWVFLSKETAPILIGAMHISSTQAQSVAI